MKRTIFAFLLCIGAAAWALDVDRNELKPDPAIQIQFENFEGTPSKVETADQISGIGASLGKNLKEGKGSDGKYSFIHLVDPSAATGFDADILILEKNSSVDHIRNLRLILSGFLTEAYGYTQDDSRLLAEFITIYNAVYRKKIDYFEKKFKPLVLSYLNSEIVGLALTYREWPGATQIVIPLSEAQKGNLGAIDTGAVTDKTVIEELKTRDDKGVEIRKDMVDLKERQVDQEEKKIEQEKRAVAAEKERIETREKEIKAQLSNVAEEKKPAAQKAPDSEVKEPSPPASPPKKDAAAAAPPETSPAAAPSAAASAPAPQPEEKEILLKEQAALEEEKKAVEKREEAVRAREETVAEKKMEIRKDRSDIASDQQQILSKEGASAVAGLPFILSASDGTAGRLVLVHPQTGEVLLTSPEAPLAVKNFEVFGGGVAAVLSRGAAGRLVVLESSSLREKIAAREDISAVSSFKTAGGQLFAVIRDSGKWYLGKYDASLALLARSRVEVLPTTFLLVAGEKIYVESGDGKAVPLGIKDMNVSD